ncbi:putative nucleic acid-binding protein [Sphingomonas sp. BE138]|uniref:type II toxin-antitoxin system VapC family toxin n=1 Tax=Sphingomonas sp. BE138 TaxID=2817845 RepID=UPI00285B1EEE|nr:PIN domain nuclease [Sphingomonas sp. BE138]MDR6787022.1 putative nucleic acid-binding protein [Sphingomonas sp. BE138]
MNVFVDTSVWIDLLADRHTLQTERGRALILSEHDLLIGDLILAEILQGTRDRRDHDRKLAMLDAFPPVTVVDRQIAIEAAHHYRTLRALGITVRKTIDTLIATRCILDNIPLLYSDRDFDPFVAHLGLRSAMT